ncbi:uncharacterized protein LOC129595678 [Paramacrobiotus metropolitanus]|uniref:uncharacterized protein LOC129595678 n=1 Tax=Paramacrobiotus metropolitanus TaxID=2943436 RepID=UPI002445D07A|nr:uncharacterized protein LOC129595678 [Paramacrobiotus metropolitanus]
MAFKWTAVVLTGFLCCTVKAFDLETDCNSYNTSQPASTIPLNDPVEFRRDRLRLEECIIYAKKESTICAMVPGIDSCMAIGFNPRRYNPIRQNYLAAECRFQNSSVVAETTKTIRLTSPKRAVTLSLMDGIDSNNSLMYDVIDPIRNQTIDLWMESCIATDLTRRIYNVGVLPNLFVLGISWCRNMTVLKEDFSRMPRIRMIIFTMSTMLSLEPGTFTDLPHLHSLILERDLFMLVPEMLPNNRGHTPNEKLIRMLDTRDYVWRLHCGCALAWLRNSLRNRPYLIKDREEGEGLTIGDYKSPQVWKNMDALSVDCSQEVDAGNIFNRNGFSYNTSCYNLVC